MSNINNLAISVNQKKFPYDPTQTYTEVCISDDMKKCKLTKKDLGITSSPASSAPVATSAPIATSAPVIPPTAPAPLAGETKIESCDKEVDAIIAKKGYVSYSDYESLWKDGTKGFTQDQVNSCLMKKGKPIPQSPKTTGGSYYKKYLKYKSKYMELKAALNH